MTTPDNNPIARLQKAALIALAFIACVYIAAAAYLGVNGHHEWRQSLTYGHTLGFTGAKGLALFEQFQSMPDRAVKRVYDMPAYQFIIAKAAAFRGTDPLAVTRYFNVVLWLLAAFAGYRFCRACGGRAAGVVCVYFLATSPLILHYYAAPLPDTLAIALSLLGLALLHSAGVGWRGVLCAAPLLIVATFVKSPVVFPFVVFYAVYAAVMAGRPALGGWWRGAAPLVALLLVLAACAVLAEQLRGILQGAASRGFFSQGAGAGRDLFFGTWDLRMSAEFWGVVYQRTRAWGASHFGLAYAIVAIVALLCSPDRRLVAVTVAGVVAFLVGWLTLAKAYFIHDYYQLSVAVIVFMSFAVSLSRIFAFAARKLSPSPTPPPRSLATKATVAMLALTPLLALAQITLQGSLSHRDSAGLWPGVAHALRDEAKFLYVRGDFSRVGGKRAVQSPTPGGRAQTKFVAVDIDDFEANCRDYLSRYAAVVSTYDSACLNGVKHQADYFIRDDGFTFYLNRGERRGIEADLLRDAAAGNRAWEVKGAGAFEYAIEEGDSGLTLVVEALRDMPWLSVALPARRLGNRRYHELEVEASAPAGVRTNIGYWNYEGKSAPIHFARAFSAGNRQSLPLRFGADRGRDYVYVDAIGIKAGQEFRVHRLRLYSSDWRREF